MKMLQIAGRAVPESAIESVLMLDYTHVAVWVIGRAEPFQCSPVEAAAVRQYVEEAMR